jgi:hypothetical protein
MFVSCAWCSLRWCCWSTLFFGRMEEGWAVVWLVVSVIIIPLFSTSFNLVSPLAFAPDFCLHSLLLIAFTVSNASAVRRSSQSLSLVVSLQNGRKG